MSNTLITLRCLLFFSQHSQNTQCKCFLSNSKLITFQPIIHLLDGTYSFCYYLFLLREYYYFIHKLNVSHMALFINSLHDQIVVIIYYFFKVKWIFMTFLILRHCKANDSIMNTPLAVNLRQEP